MKVIDREVSRTGIFPAGNARTTVNSKVSLEKVPLFEGLSKKELRLVLKECLQEDFLAGERIVAEGEPGGRFYLILQGQAKVIVADKPQGSLGPGEFFGEISIIDRRPRSATVTAQTSVRALSIASWNFLAVMNENFPIARKVMGQLCGRIRDRENGALRS
jgi:CRP/FNR family transcriptional regulator, cyclic AMP receptor protein